MGKKSEKGVFKAYKKDKTEYYRASVTYKGKHISLGSFRTEKEASECYLAATKLLADKTVKIEDYSGMEPIPFPKWVSLINFRDNGIYCPNPIYLRPSFFNYYLSPDKILKFDKDDLFYFSSHKIMERGNHLFVSEFGMQTNLLSRYHINAYSVPGRDYRFRNNDPHDFRYNNLEIINRYRGVERTTSGRKISYSVKIHLNGYYKVGTYPTETEAAIAYNKAADELQRKGYHKNFATNYIEDLSPKEYAETYSRIKISQRLLNLPPKSPVLPS